MRDAMQSSACIASEMKWEDDNKKVNNKNHNALHS